MSAKGQVTQITHGAYPTPPWCVHRLLEHEVSLWSQNIQHWLEPAWGDGAIARAVNAHLTLRSRVRPYWTGVDIELRGGTGVSDVRYTEDYLQWDGGARQLPFDVAITNPDFPLFFDYARKMLEDAKVVWLLGRLNILGSGKRSGRSAWLRANAPKVRVLPDRPVFAHKLQCSRKCKGVMVAYDAPTPERIMCPCVRGKAIDSVGEAVLYRKACVDAAEYAWFGWERGKASALGDLAILRETPNSERVDRIVP